MNVFFAFYGWFKIYNPLKIYKIHQQHHHQQQHQQQQQQQQ